MAETNATAPDPSNGLPSVALRRAVTDLLLAVHAGLNLPDPATLADERAYLQLLADRAMWIKSTLGRLLDRGLDTSALDLPQETARLREQLRRYPPTPTGTPPARPGTRAIRPEQVEAPTDRHVRCWQPPIVPGVRLVGPWNSFRVSPLDEMA